MYPCTGLERPLGFQEIVAPRFQNSRYMKAGCLTYAPAAFTPVKILLYWFLLEAESTLGLAGPEGLKNSNDITRYLLWCNTVHYLHVNNEYNITKELCVFEYVCVCVCVCMCVFYKTRFISFVIDTSDLVNWNFFFSTGYRRAFNFIFCVAHPIQSVCLYGLAWVRDWDNAVGIATCCGLDSSGIESQWGREFPHTFRTALGHTQPPVKRVPGLFRG